MRPIVCFFRLSSTKSLPFEEKHFERNQTILEIFVRWKIINPDAEIWNAAHNKE
jgi:hypothetical protein